MDFIFKEFMDIEHRSVPLLDSENVVISNLWFSCKIVKLGLKFN